MDIATSQTQQAHSDSDRTTLLAARRCRRCEALSATRHLLIASSALNVLLLIILMFTPRSSNPLQHASIAACTATSNSNIQRFIGPAVSEMTVQQRAIYDEIRGSRPTGVAGPFGPWLASPGIAQPAQQLGRVVRLETSLPRVESEIAILLTAARHNSTTEWTIHEAEARKAGVSGDAIEAIRRGTRPHGLSPRTAAVYGFVHQLLSCSAVDNAVYEAARDALGEVALVELTAIAGYYGLVAYTLNAFHIRLPPAPQ